MQKVNRFWIKLITVIAMVVFSMLALMNLLITGYFEDTYGEFTYFRIDYFWIGIPIIAILIWGACLIQRKIGFEKASGKFITLVLFMYAFTWGLGWILMSRSFPVFDRRYVSDIAVQFIKGDYSAYDTAGYLFWYPYQTGIVACIELIYRVVGPGNFNAVKIVNALMVALTFVALYLSAGIMFEGKKQKRIQNLTTFLGFGCIAAMFFVTIVYGNVIGMALAVWAVYFELRFLKTKKAINILPAAILITLAYIVKSNYAVFIIGMVMFLLLDALKSKKWTTALLAVGIVVCYMVGSKGIMSYYSARADRDLNEGIPKVAWIQMGLKEGWFGYGTYDESTLNLYRKFNFDSKMTSKESVRIIGERLNALITDPGYGLNFIFEKNALQWCEPTYQSIWESNCSNNHDGELSELTQNIYVGWRHDLLVEFMDIYQSLIWLCAAVWVIINRKGMDEKKLLLATIVLGGVAFHTFWEAKSQYVLQYFVILIPYAAAGLSDIIDIINKKIYKVKEK